MVHYSGAKSEISVEELAEKEANAPRAYFIAEEKLDGIWAELRVDGEGKISFFSRNDQDKSMLDGVKDLCDRLQFPEMKSSVFACELGYGSQKATEFYRANGYRWVRVFDVLKFRGTWLIKPREAIPDGEALQQETLKERLSILRRIRKAPGTVINKREILWTERAAEGFVEFYRRIVARGGEGIMLKKHHDFWQEGKTDSMFKVKKEVTGDYFIMGYDMSDAESHQGLIKNIVVGLQDGDHLREVMRVGSFTNEVRKLISENMDVLKGAKVEITGYELFSSGALRHPSFLRWRVELVEDEDLPGKILSYNEE